VFSVSFLSSWSPISSASTDPRDLRGVPSPLLPFIRFIPAYARPAYTMDLNALLSRVKPYKGLEHINGWLLRHDMMAAMAEWSDEQRVAGLGVLFEGGAAVWLESEELAN